MKKKRTGKVTLVQIKTTLSELGEVLGFVVERMVTKQDLKEQLKNFATKDDLNEGLFAIQTQINGIESDIREIKRVYLEA